MASSTTQSARAAAIIPARLGSTRLQRKMLLDDTGRPLFAHTVQAVVQAQVFERVVLATDAPEIASAAEALGIEALMTDPNHPSGSDRVCEALDLLAERGEHFDLIVNVQGDEPEIGSEDLALLVQRLWAESHGSSADPTIQMATLAAELMDPNEWNSPDVVKVVSDSRQRALYFSRAPIPSRTRARKGSGQGQETGQAVLGQRHIGVYAFQPEALRAFCQLPPSRLEQLENLEQLRWLEAGRQMLVVPASQAPPGIDTQSDYDSFVDRWRSRSEPASPTSRPQ